MIDDPTLLRRYATERAEEAFAEFVQRHLPLVYSAAVRRLGGDTHRAEDVAQVVFCTVARDAHRLSTHAMLTGWLYTATRNAVIDVIRAEKRRRGREKEAHIMQEILSVTETEADWSRLRPVLDAALDELNGNDREAVLLRFFQGRPFAEVGSMLGVSEDTARKRVERALDKLRSLLRRHRIASTSAALATLLATETISAAPASLAATITGAALATGGATAGAVTLLTVTKLQAGIAAVVIAGGAVGLITQQRTISDLREVAASHEQTLASLANEKAALARMHTEAEAELARLRAEVAGLSSTPATTNRPTPSANVSQLKTPGAAAVATVSSPSPSASNSGLLQQKRARLHRRFDPFFAQRGLTPAQGERLVDLMLLQADAREDLQAAVREKGLKGDAKGVEALRTKLYAPITRELREILGAEGYAAYVRYEAASFYRSGIVEPMQASFVSASVALSSEQLDQLAAIAAANDHPRRMNASDIGTVARIDWDAVVNQSTTVLTPEQQAVLRSYAEDAKARLGP